MNRRTLAVIVGAFLIVGSVAAQRSARRAAPDENVAIILNHVKADKRQQFETFTEALGRASSNVAKSNTTEKKVREQVRLIVPTAPNSDGTYTYVWIFDPVLKDGSYGYEDVLTRGLGATEAKKYLALNDEALARPQESYQGKQSKVW